MSEQQALEPSGAGASRPLPDINAETFPFDLVQQVLDQAAYINLFAFPEAERPVEPISDGGGVIGYRTREVLHRFRIELLPASAAGGLRAINVVGERLGRSEHCWLVAPDGFDTDPSRIPPPTRFDAQRSQYLAVEGRVWFGDGGESFRGSGAGRTYPGLVGEGLALGAVCDAMEATGRLNGLPGTCTWSASLEPQTGVSGNLLCRFVDPRGLLRTDRSLPELRLRSGPDPGVTYIPFRGQKSRSQRTFYTFGPEGRVSGIRLDPQIRLVDVDAALDERGQVRAVTHVGSVAGRLEAWIFLDLLAPLPTAEDIPFSDYDEYYFEDSAGGQVATLGADGGGGARIGRAAPVPGEGLSYTLQLPGLPGQPALRFGGFAPLVRGTGRFAGARGMMSHNSAVGLTPHVLSTVFVLRLADRAGAFRA